MLGQIVVNVAVVGAAAVLVLVLVSLLTDAAITFSVLLIPYVVVGVACFCGIGAVIGSVTDSRDGAIAASNAIGLPLLFLSETFVHPDQLPGWFLPFVDLSPLTYFARGVRAAIDPASEAGSIAGVDPALANLAILSLLAVVALAVGTRSIPLTE